MDIEKQNQFLLNLVNRLFVDLGAHLEPVSQIRTGG